MDCCLSRSAAADCSCMMVAVCSLVEVAAVGHMLAVEVRMKAGTCLEVGANMIG